MAKTSPLRENYFPHDYSMRERKGIKKILRDMGYEGYGIYWAILEFMFRDELMPGEESLVINEEYTDKVKNVLNNYELFQIEDGCYVSERINENIEYLEKKSEQATDAVNIRWVLSDFDKQYKKVFGQEPILSAEEINTLKKYYKQIPDLRKKYPAIFATLHSIKFDTKMFFTPRANWLLKDNNLLQILNGQYGELKTIVSENDKKIAQNTKALVKKELESISSKEDAIQFAVKHSSRAELETSDAAKEFMNTWNFTIQDFVKAGGKNG